MKTPKALRPYALGRLPDENDAAFEAYVRRLETAAGESQRLSDDGEREKAKIGFEAFLRREGVHHAQLATNFAGVSLTYAEFEQILSITFQTQDQRQLSRLRSRFKHFQHLGIPLNRRPGRGTRTTYSATHLVEVVLCLQLAEFGIDPFMIVGMIKQFQDDWQKHIRLIASGKESIKELRPGVCQAVELALCLGNVIYGPGFRKDGFKYYLIIEPSFMTNYYKANEEAIPVVYSLEYSELGPTSRSSLRVAIIDLTELGQKLSRARAQVVGENGSGVDPKASPAER